MRENEGGFSDNPHDKGGATIYGISSKWFPNDYSAIMGAPTQEEKELLTKQFYYNHFYNPLYDKIFYEPLAVRLFDLGVNLGKGISITLLQETFNRLSQNKISEDGKFGEGTLRGINLPPIVHENFYSSYQKRTEEYYRGLKDFSIFGKGWLNRLYKPTE